MPSRPDTDAVLWFVREVFPLVRAALPDVVFHVIGSKAPSQILELAHDGVIVHGFVADIAPYMDGCRLSVAPLRYGAGVKGKVNMAMSYGLQAGDLTNRPEVQKLLAKIRGLPEEYALKLAFLKSLKRATIVGE